MKAMMMEVLQPIRDEMTTLSSQMLQLEENLHHQLETTQESIAQRLDFSQVAILQTVNSCQVLLHKLDSSQEGVVQKIDGQRVVVDSLLSGITGATDNTKQALMETVNSSSNALLQKLDLTQQDVLKQTQVSHAVLESVANNQGAFAKQMESGHEFTRKRLNDIEDTLARKVMETGAEVRNLQVEKADGLTQHIQSWPISEGGAPPWWNRQNKPQLHRRNE